MDFRLTEEQQMLRDMVRKIAEKEFAPRAAEIDHKEEFPWENKKILEENGLLGVQIPEQYGGAGADPDVGRKAALEDTEKLIQVLDGADLVGSDTEPDNGPLGYYLYYDRGPYTVRGGRHSLTHYLDAWYQVLETSEPVAAAGYHRSPASKPPLVSFIALLDGAPQIPLITC